uniref:Armadillo repeat containing 3 n=1 Tax=Oncorhynchus kisutch TaxID=8019 RepID=A0A8C7FUU2_ONCKI
MGKKVKKESEPPSKDVFDPLPIESKKAATVVLMLNSPEEEVLVKACEAIHKFAEKGDENRSSLLGLGAVEPLSHLISHEDKLVRRNAFMALGVMAANSDVKRLLKKLDAIPSIIRKLSPEEDVVVHEFATLCLASLSVDFSCKVQISDQEGLEPLIQLLSSPDPDVKKNSVETICNLVQDLPSRVAVRELNGIPPLLELLRSEFPVIQQLSLRTLVIVTTDTDTRATFREEQGFDRLLEFLCNKEFSDLHVEALQVLSNCLEDRDSLQLIHETGGLQRLLQFITTPTLLDIQTNAVKAISRVAQSSENRKLLHEQDIERSLVELLSLEGDSLRTATCQAVAAMSLHLASKDAFRDLDGIRAVVQLLGSEGGEVREAAAQALSSLTSSNQLNSYAVYEAEGDEGLVQQLHDVIPGAVAHAAAVLTNMAEQEVLRCSILSHGAMAALLEPLQSADTHTLVRATQALAALACDAEGRTWIKYLNAGGLVPLVQLLRSNHKEVRRNACWAISVCANDEPTAVEMCKLGALDLLQEINSSANRRNKFSEIALQRLLDSNLSLKYSLTNTLAPTDITVDGFYDPGQVELCVTSFSALTSLSLSLSLSKAVPLSLVVAAAVQPLSAVMGGAVEVDRQHDFLWELHLSELRYELQSNIIPIGQIRKGTYYHRALLYKVLADRIGVSCSLVRGEYNRVWNEVLLSVGTPHYPGCQPQPRAHLVDLIHQPGRLLRANTPQAKQYQTI